VSCLAQGNACTSSISGFASHFYNPAGLGRLKRKETEWHLVVGETHVGSHTIGALQTIRTYEFSKLLRQFENQSGQYQFLNLSSFPSVTFRNFSFGILGSYQLAALPSSSTVDIDSRQDLIPTLGFSRHFAGNLLRLGISGKLIYRNQMKGVFSFSEINSTPIDQWGTKHREGMGLGIDSGLLLTFPHRFLPTLGFSWLNMFNTHFEGSKIVNLQSSGTPDSIPQAFHVGLSLSPILTKGWKYTFSVDYQNLELHQVSWKKRLHLGLQLENEKTLFFWAGLNQLYLTGGIGLRLKGGHLEVGTYAKEVGSEENSQQDRRYFGRFTVSF